MDSILTEDEFKDDYKLLNAEVRRLGVNIPPLVNSYMSLSPTMKMFGGGINHEFSEAEETCILINFDEIHETKRERHINSFIKEKMENIRKRFPVWADEMGDNLSEMLLQKRAQVQANIEARRKKRQARRNRKKLNS